MKLSIVTASRNQGRYLENAILSVLSQGAPCELIVVDAMSSDKSVDILEKYRARIDHLIREPDNGPADALNKGFRLASGEILGYLNADDEYLLGALNCALECFRKFPRAQVIYGNGIMIDAEGNKLRHLYSDRWCLAAYMRGACSVVQPATFFRRTAYLRTQGFNSWNRTCWDGEMLLDLAAAGGRFLHVDENWAAFRMHSESISGSQRLRDVYRQDVARLFERTYGRRRNRRDAFLGALFRLLRAIRNPGRLRETLLNREY